MIQRVFGAILFLTLGFYDSYLYACDPNKTGEFVRGYDNIGHAGSYEIQKLKIWCENQNYAGELICEGELPIKNTAKTEYEITTFNVYRHKGNVKIDINDQRFLLIIPDGLSSKCGTRKRIKGVYRQFTDTDELLPNDSSSCNAFVKKKK